MILNRIADLYRLHYSPDDAGGQRQTWEMEKSIWCQAWMTDDRAAIALDFPLWEVFTRREEGVQLHDRLVLRGDNGSQTFGIDDENAIVIELAKKLPLAQMENIEKWQGPERKQNGNILC